MTKIITTQTYTIMVSGNRTLVWSTLSWGPHAKILGWAKYLWPTTDVLPNILLHVSSIFGSTSDLWTITYKIGIRDKQKSCVMCVKFSNE